MDCIMTKKEKRELALKLKAEINSKKIVQPKKELSEGERKLKKQQEIRTRDKAKNRSGKNVLGSKNDKPSEHFDPWSTSW